MEMKTDSIYKSEKLTFILLMNVPSVSTRAIIIIVSVSKNSCVMTMITGIKNEIDIRNGCVYQVVNGKHIRKIV
jgi:hypothetical protein